jgi:hypothetical protein
LEADESMNLVPGAEVESYGISAFGLASVRVESGSLIGKKLFMDPGKLNK